MRRFCVETLQRDLGRTCLVGREAQTCNTKKEQKQKQMQTHEQCVALGLACVGVLERREERSCAVLTCFGELSKEEGFGKARVLAPVPSEDLREGSRFASESPSHCSCIGPGSLKLGSLVLSMWCVAVGMLGSSWSMCREASWCVASMFCVAVYMCSAVEARKPKP